MGIPKIQRSEQPATFSSGTYARAEIRKVLTHPSPLLMQRAELVEPGDPETARIARELVATMRSSKGCVGLAAPQLGELVRIIAIDVTGHKKARSCAGLVVLCNPRIVARDGNVMMREGCLSVPELTGDVARAAEVTVEGVEPGTDHVVRIDADAIEARCFLHEIDHLDGVLFFDRVLDPTAQLFARKTYA
jgi:peptide deformylase